MYEIILRSLGQNGARDLSIISYTDLIRLRRYAFLSIILISHQPIKIRNLVHFPNFVSHPKYQNKAQIRLHFLYCVIHILAFFHMELTKVELHFSDFSFTKTITKTESFFQFSNPGNKSSSPGHMTTCQITWSTTSK